VVANPLRIREDDFIPGRIDHCPECDSEKVVFPRSRGRKKKECRESTGDVRAAAAGVPERLHGCRHQGREASRKFLTFTSVCADELQS